MRNAFAYLRVSSAGQVDGHGFDRQREAVDDYAKRNGLRIVETFQEAHTGTEADRPAFSAMLGAIKGNGVRTVLIERLDRFAREIGVQIMLLSMLQTEGVTLIEATTGRDVTAAVADDPMAKAMVQIQGVFHQAEKELLVRRLRKARDAIKAKTGFCGGVRPYGELPGEAELLATVKRLNRKRPNKPRRSAAQIAMELERMGLPTRTGKPWSRHSVREILKRLG